MAKTIKKTVIALHKRIYTYLKPRRLINGNWKQGTTSNL
jgi:hypothetical protein